MLSRVGRPRYIYRGRFSRGPGQTSVELANAKLCGTIYGGSIYASIDPIYMLMLIHILGPEYVVWDKAAKIRCRKPGKETLYAEFNLSGDEIDEIKRLAETERSVDRVYDLELKNKEGVVHAEIEKTLYIRKKGTE